MSRSVFWAMWQTGQKTYKIKETTTTTTTFAMSTVIKGNKLFFRAKKGKRNGTWRRLCCMPRCDSLRKGSLSSSRADSLKGHQQHVLDGNSGRFEGWDEIKTSTWTSSCSWATSTKHVAADDDGDVIPEGLAAWRFHGSYLKVQPAVPEGYGVRQKVLNSNVTIMSFKTCVRREKIRRKRGVFFCECCCCSSACGEEWTLTRFSAKWLRYRFEHAWVEMSRWYPPWRCGWGKCSEWVW